VAGVYKDTAANSQLQFDFVVSSDMKSGDYSACFRVLPFLLPV
jgi:hypothetical protein